MKSITILTIGIVMAAIVCSPIFISKGCDSNPQPDTHHVNGFAVLELFTSQGCSSCPAAEALLARIQKATKDKPVYILSYHVDYWNRLGWKDVFSKQQFTDRQYEYSKHLSGQVYTPQLIINGNEEFVGSDSVAISTALNRSLQTSSATSLVIHARRQSSTVEITYQLSGSTKFDKLLIAVVTKNASTNVKRGENGGRTLSHVQIVRQLSTFNLTRDGNGTETISLPQELNNNESEIIAFIQDPTTGIIKAATVVE